MPLLIISPHNSISHIWAVGRNSGNRRCCLDRTVRDDAVPAPRTPAPTCHTMDIFSKSSYHIHHTVQKRQPATAEATAAEAATAAERSLPEFGRTPLVLVGVLGKPLELVTVFRTPLGLLGLFGTPRDPDWLLHLPLDLVARPPSLSSCCFRRFTGVIN